MWSFLLNIDINKQTPGPLVRERTIPTERPPLVDEILVSTCVDRGVSRGQRGGSPTVVNLSFLDRSRYFWTLISVHQIVYHHMHVLEDYNLYIFNLRTSECFSLHFSKTFRKGLLTFIQLIISWLSICLCETAGFPQSGFFWQSILLGYTKLTYRFSFGWNWKKNVVHENPG
jgi:hypothetical protein